MWARHIDHCWAAAYAGEASETRSILRRQRLDLHGAALVTLDRHIYISIKEPTFAGTEGDVRSHRKERQTSETWSERTPCTEPGGTQLGRELIQYRLHLCGEEWSNIRDFIGEIEQP